MIASGQSHSVREFIERAFALVGVALRWEGRGANEIGIDAVSGQTRVRVNPKYYRPADIDSVLGDPSKAKQSLGWEAEVKFDQLVELMMQADLAEVKESV